MTSFNSGKKFAFATAMMASVMSLSACSSNYVISTNDGHMITTAGKPAIDKETGISYNSMMLKRLCKSKPALITLLIAILKISPCGKTEQ